MHRDTRAALRKHLLHYLDTHTTDYADSIMTVPATHYHDPAHLRRELERVVLVNPMIAAHGSELAEPGATVTVSRGGETLAVTREADGALRAHLGTGRTRRTVDYPLDEYAGFVWLIPTEGAELDMAARLGPELDRDTAASEVGAAQLYRKREYHLEMNWKLVMEGFTDAYHLQFVHPRTVGPFFHTNIYRVDRFGTNWRMITARRGIEDFRAEDADLDRFPDFAIAGINIYPGSMMARAPAHFEVWGIRPDLDDLAKCWVTLYFLVPELPTTEKGVRFRERNWDMVIDAVRDEDWVVARSVGDSLASGAMPHVVYGRNEKCTQVFHGLLNRDLADDPATVPEPPA